jgi:chaperonin cofactor prefoldin|tara:strand:+ start:106 stop:1122 length:1017 start_codon:yes stop_codon:yes gene_type:complete
MSEKKDIEKIFQKDFSEETNVQTKSIKDTLDLAFKEIDRTAETSKSLTEMDFTSEKIDRTAEANESLVEMDSDQSDQTLEIMSKTLASIDAKMDVENLQLKKLDQLSKIKDQLNKLGSTGVGDVNEIEEEIVKSNIEHNKKEISDLVEKIDTLEKKILTIENQSNASNERFKKIESTVKRFENLETELPNVFKNLFKKKEKIESKEKNFQINEPEVIKKIIPKNTTTIIEEAEGALNDTITDPLILENSMSETFINDDYKEDLFKDDKESKPYVLKYALRIFLLLCVTVPVLFLIQKFFPNFIILNFDEISNNAFFLINSTFEKLLFYFNLILMPEIN